MSTSRITGVPLRTKKNQLTTLPCYLHEDTKTYWVSVSAGVMWVGPHKGKQTLSSLPNEPAAKGSAFYLIRPMFTVSLNKRGEKLCQGRDSFVAGLRNVWVHSAPPHHPVTHLLGIPTLILISEVKVVWNYFCLGNFLQIPAMTTDTVKRLWALNPGFAPLAEEKVRGHLLSVHCASGAELRALHTLFPWTLERTCGGRHSHPCFQTKLSRLKKNKIRRGEVSPWSQGHEWTGPQTQLWLTPRHLSLLAAPPYLTFPSRTLETTASSHRWYAASTSQYSGRLSIHVATVLWWLLCPQCSCDVDFH